MPWGYGARWAAVLIGGGGSAERVLAVFRRHDIAEGFESEWNKLSEAGGFPPCELIPW